MSLQFQLDNLVIEANIIYIFGINFIRLIDRQVNMNEMSSVYRNYINHKVYERAVKHQLVLNLYMILNVIIYTPSMAMFVTGIRQKCL
jgi:hypothetical protein